MEPVTMISLAMMAAGAVTQGVSANSSKKYRKLGMQLDDAALASNLELLNAASEAESVAAIDSLRESLGTQTAIMAARGMATDSSQAVAISQKSNQKFAQDERFRTLNTMSKAIDLKSGNVKSYIDMMAKNRKDVTDIGVNALKNIPVSSLESYFKNPGKTTGAQSNGSFGMEDA